MTFDMKNQVLSIAQMQHLQELGLNTSDASMHYQFYLQQILSLMGRMK